MDIVMTTGASYVPRNISGTFLGPMLAREALANSRNIPALRVLSTTGVSRVAQLLRAGGVAHVDVDGDSYGLGLALGDLPVTALELGSLYRSLARGGLSTTTRFFTDEESHVGQHLVRAETAQLVLGLLSDPAARQPSFPAGSPLDYDYAVAVKTGTSQGFRDGWTVAVSDRAVVVAWVGNHDWRSMDHLGGLAGTAEMAHDIMDEVMIHVDAARPATLSFADPRDSVRRTVCAMSGRLAGQGCPHARSEVFLRGTEPVDRCTVHHDVDIDVRNGLRATLGCDAHFVRQVAMVDLPSVYASWARLQHLDVAPVLDSPLCGAPDVKKPSIVLREPLDHMRLAFDPDTPPAYATLRLQADTQPLNEEVVFLVDGEPVATVGYPQQARWTLVPGNHTIQAAFAHRPEVSLASHIRVLE
jgi:penicillin-binding protein 1C